MNGISPDTIFAVIVGAVVAIFLAICSFISWIYIKPRWNKRNDIRRKHHTELVDKIFKKIKDMNFPYDNYNYKLTDLENLKKSRLFVMASNHLKSYLKIKESWEKTNESIYDMNAKLEDIKDYVSDKITNDLDENYLHDLLNIINSIIKFTLNGQLHRLEDIEFEIRKDGLNIKITSDGKTHQVIRPKDYNLEDIQTFLTNLIEDDGFQHRIEQIHDENTKSKGAFEVFKENLTKLIKQFEYGHDLKGKCSECPSFWKL
jgi:hypothetical protein